MVSWLLLANSSVVKMMSSLRCCWPRSRVDVGRARARTVSVCQARLPQLFARAADCRSRWCQLIMVHECVTRCVERCVDARWRSPRRQRQLAACKTLGNRHRIFVCGGVFRRAVRSVDGVGGRRTGSPPRGLRALHTKGRACRATRPRLPRKGPAISCSSAPASRAARGPNAAP